MNERLGEEPLPSSYGEVINLLEKTVPLRVDIDDIDEAQYSEPRFDGKFGFFYLPTELTEDMGLGMAVRSRVVGTRSMGVAVLVRPRWRINRKVEGFYVQPTPHHARGMKLWDPEREYEIYQGPARWPSLLGRHEGHELVEADRARLAKPVVARALIRAFQIHAEIKEQSLLRPRRPHHQYDNFD